MRGCHVTGVTGGGGDDFEKDNSQWYMICNILYVIYDISYIIEEDDGQWYDNLRGCVQSHHQKSPHRCRWRHTWKTGSGAQGVKLFFYVLIFDPCFEFWFWFLIHILNFNPCFEWFWLKCSGPIQRWLHRHVLITGWLSSGSHSILQYCIQSGFIFSFFPFFVFFLALVFMLGTVFKFSS